MTVPEAFRLERTADHTYQGPHEPGPAPAHDVVFGGQILAQMIMASALEHGWSDESGREAAGKEVKSLHVLFPRAARLSEPVGYHVDALHDGRTFSSDAVTCVQGGKVMARGLLLSTADEPDFIRHDRVDAPSVQAPDALPVAGIDGRVVPGAEARPAGAGHVWTRYPDAPDPSVASSVAVHQGVLAWATDGYMIGAALAQHAGYDESEAHRSIATGVVSHSISFHDRFDVRQWLLLANDSVWAGRGRAHGRCDVFDAGGRLVATCTQDAMVKSAG